MPSYITGRINCVLVYNALSPKHVVTIALQETRKLAKKPYKILINRVHASHLTEIAGNEEVATEGARPVRTAVGRKFETLFQDYEGDKSVLLDIDETPKLTPSSDVEPCDIAELASEIASKIEIDERNAAPTVAAPTLIELPTERHFSEYSAEKYPEALGLLKIDNGLSGEGTAFLVSPDGHLLTCAHCIVPGKRLSFVDHSNEEHEAIVIFEDRDADIAVLKIAVPNKKLPYLNLTTSVVPLKNGTEVGLLAYPKGSALGSKVSLSVGIISKYERNMYFTSAMAAEGSSGGALFSLDGIDDGIVYGILNGGYGKHGVNLNVATNITRLYNDTIVIR